jgi:hypothetical protein
VDLGFSGHPRKAAHFISQGRKKRNPDSEILATTQFPPLESAHNAPLYGEKRFTERRICPDRLLELRFSGLRSSIAQRPFR